MGGKEPEDSAYLVEFQELYYKPSQILQLFLVVIGPN